MGKGKPSPGGYVDIAGDQSVSTDEPPRVIFRDYTDADERARVRKWEE
jgi:hypothetical protein